MKLARLLRNDDTAGKAIGKAVEIHSLISVGDGAKNKRRNPEKILSSTDLNAALVPSEDWMLRLLLKNSSRIWVSEC